MLRAKLVHSSVLYLHLNSDCLSLILSLSLPICLFYIFPNLLLFFFRHIFTRAIPPTLFLEREKESRAFSQTLKLSCQTAHVKKHWRIRYCQKSNNFPYYEPYERSAIAAQTPLRYSIIVGFPLGNGLQTRGHETHNNTFLCKFKHWSLFREARLLG